MEYSLYLCIFFGETKANLHDSTKEYLSAKLNGMELITVLWTIVYLIKGQVLGEQEYFRDVSSIYFIAVS